MEMSSFNYQVKKHHVHFMHLNYELDHVPLVTTVEVKQEFLFGFGDCPMKTTDFNLFDN